MGFEPYGMRIGGYLTGGDGCWFVDHTARRLVLWDDRPGNLR